MENESYVYLKTPRGRWYFLPEVLEPLFNQLLEESILNESSAKFIREFKEYEISNPSTHRKQFKK